MLDAWMTFPIHVRMAANNTYLEVFVFCKRRTDDA